MIIFKIIVLILAFAGVVWSIVFGTNDKLYSSIREYITNPAKRAGFLDYMDNRYRKTCIWTSILQFILLLLAILC